MSYIFWDTLYVNLYMTHSLQEYKSLTSSLNALTLASIALQHLAMSASLMSTIENVQ